MNTRQTHGMLCKIAGFILSVMLLLTAMPAFAQTQQELYQQGLDALYGRNGAAKNPEQALIIWLPCSAMGIPARTGRKSSACSRPRRAWAIPWRRSGWSIWVYQIKKAAIKRAGVVKPPALLCFRV